MSRAINTTSILVTWTPPWPHPVNHYAISVNNTVTYTVRTTSFIIYRMNTSIDECHGINITVTAGTDVGSSPPSLPFITGFPICK